MAEKQGMEALIGLYNETDSVDFLHKAQDLAKNYQVISFCFLRNRKTWCFEIIFGGPAIQNLPFGGGEPKSFLIPRGGTKIPSKTHSLGTCIVHTIKRSICG